MPTEYRDSTIHDGTIVQGSMTTDVKDYKDLDMDTLIKGVILEVYPSDSEENRSSQQTSLRHGHTHECTVLAVDDGGSAYTIYKNVIITPDCASGLDDYSEKLPRPARNLVDGSTSYSNLKSVDPYNLDGDWCVIGFIGKRIDSPFVLRWWPHARNTFDTATSGLGYDGEALVQDKRYFKRVNGLEVVVNGEGDLMVSTTYANSTLTPGEDPKLGRFARDLDPEVGGSVKILIKPTQTFELDFNKQRNGIGCGGIPDDAIPQENPPQGDTNPESTELEETYIYVDRDQIDFYIPQNYTVVVKNNISHTASKDISYTASNTLQLEGSQIKLGENAGTDPVVLGEKLRAWLRDDCRVDSPFGPLKLAIDPLQALFNDVLSEKSVVE